MRSRGVLSPAVAYLSFGDLLYHSIIFVSTTGCAAYNAMSHRMKVINAPNLVPANSGLPFGPGEWALAIVVPLPLAAYLRSLYFVQTPRDFSTGYLAAFFSSFAWMAAARSMPATSASSMR